MDSLKLRYVVVVYVDGTVVVYLHCGQLSPFSAFHALPDITVNTPAPAASRAMSRS
jgi:hypothetical protein